MQKQIQFVIPSNAHNSAPTQFVIPSNAHKSAPRARPELISEVSITDCSALSFENNEHPPELTPCVLKPMLVEHNCV